MDTQTSDYFADVVAAAEKAFRLVEHSTDSTPERAILRLRATYGRHRVFVTELLSGDVRKYRYYLLLDDWVVAGFDKETPTNIFCKNEAVPLKQAQFFSLKMYRLKTALA